MCITCMTGFSTAEDKPVIHYTCTLYMFAHCVFVWYVCVLCVFAHVCMRICACVVCVCVC